LARRRCRSIAILETSEHHRVIGQFGSDRGERRVADNRGARRERGRRSRIGRGSNERHRPRRRRIYAFEVGSLRRHDVDRRCPVLFAIIEKMTREGPQGETKAIPGQASHRAVHLCAISGLSRASCYRWLEPKLSARDDADLRDLIQRLALKRRHEGYRRITRRLREKASSSTPSACSGSCGPTVCFNGWGGSTRHFRARHSPDWFTRLISLFPPCFSLLSPFSPCSGKVLASIFRPKRFVFR
jgi:hypothetical protein